MRIALPGPGALLGEALAAAGSVETAVQLLPRAAAAMTRVESLLDRVESLVDRADTVVGRADETAVRAENVLATAEIVTRETSRAADGAQGLVDRMDASLTAWEPSMRRLAPSVSRFADALDRSEVTAAISLVDRLPALLDHVENDVLPTLRTLERVGPDLHEVLEVVEDLRRVVTGLPGIGLLRRRGEEEPPPVPGSVHHGNGASPAGRSPKASPRDGSR